MPKKNLFSTAVWIAGLSAISKLLGLIRESTLAGAFGATGVTDAYKIAFSLPNIFFAVIAAAIGQTFIPVYAEYLKKGDPEKNNRFLNNLVSWLIVCSAGLLVPLYLFLPAVIRFIAPGFTVGTMALAQELAFIMLPAAAFFILSSLASAYLQSHNRFIAPTLVWYPHNLFIIGSIMLGGMFGIKGVAWGSLFAFASMLLIQLPSVYRAGFRYRFVLDRHDPGVGQIIRLSGPVLIGVCFTQGYIIIDRILASGLSEGSISALDYANRVNSLTYNIFVLTIATVLYPSLASAYDEPEKFRRLIGKALRIMGMIALPITMGLIILRQPIIEVLFQRGAFNAGDTLVTTYALAGLSIGIIGIAFREILNRAFYALKDTKTPMINGVIAILFNIAFSVVFIRLWGIGGLALGTSLAAILSGAMLVYKLKQKLGTINGAWIGEGLLKTALATVLFSGAVYLSYESLAGLAGSQASSLIKLLCMSGSGLAGVSVYAAVLWFVKLEEIGDLKQMVLSKMDRRRAA